MGPNLYSEGRPFTSVGNLGASISPEGESGHVAGRFAQRSIGRTPDLASWQLHRIRAACSQLSPLAFLRPTIGAAPHPLNSAGHGTRFGKPTRSSHGRREQGRRRGDTERESEEYWGEREASKAESASVGPNMTSTIPWVHEGDNSATANIEDLGLRLTRDKEGKVHVTFSRPPTAASVQLLKTLPSIQSLRLTGSGVNGTDVALLNELPAVESVHLDGMQFTEGGFDQVKRWAALKGLSLWGDTIDDSALALLQEVPHLTSLNLSGTSATKNGVQFIRNLPRLENLSVMGFEWEGGTRINRSSRMTKWLILKECRISSR